jgi:ABC-type multidrug transport system ATPase subunit
VFFSSHVLSDAEALCSRVAILAKGRLVTAGKLTDMLAFQIRGWEVVAAAVQSDLLARLTPQAVSVTGLGTTATCSNCRSIPRPKGSSATSLPPAPRCYR